MDLKTGKLLWLDSYPNAPAYPELNEDISCDILIIGGGEAGALCSYHLKDSNLKTVLIEKRKVGLGSTSANTALIQFGNDKTLTSCINTFGENVGVRYYKLCENAVNYLEHIYNDVEIDFEFKRRYSLYYATTKQDVPKLREEYQTLKKHGFKVNYLEREDMKNLFSFAREGAIYIEGDAEINPYKLAHSLINHCYNKGMEVYEKTEIQAHGFEGSKIVFHTTEGFNIKTKYAIFSSGYETQIFEPNKNALLISTYAIATQPISNFEGWHNKCLIWETARPYLYLRTTSDNRIIAGGLDESKYNKEDRDSKLYGKRDLLIHKIKELFPHITDPKPEYFWSATFGSTHDGMPLIGPHPKIPGGYMALGYGGNGTVYSTIAGQILRDLITKGSHPDASMFLPSRLKI